MINLVGTKKKHSILDTDGRKPHLPFQGVTSDPYFAVAVATVTVFVQARSAERLMTTQTSP